MENTLKYNTYLMKVAIKRLVEEQKMLKNQRKTVHLVGERIMEPDRAWYKHYTNRLDLRVLYAAYGIARGKSFSQIENKYPEEGHPLNKRQGSIDRILEGYRVEEKELVE